MLEYHGGMSVQAVGTYFDHLIELQGLKMKAVMAQAGVQAGYLSRLISGDIKQPAATTLRAITEAVGGSWEDVGVLLSEAATSEHAEVLAEAWFTKVLGASGENREALRARLASAAQELLKNPDLLNQ